MGAIDSYIAKNPRTYCDENGKEITTVKIDSVKTGSPIFAADAGYHARNFLIKQRSPSRPLKIMSSAGQSLPLFR